MRSRNCKLINKNNRAVSLEAVEKLCKFIKTAAEINCVAHTTDIFAVGKLSIQFTVSFSLSNADQVSVDIYNVLGHKVLCLYEGTAPEHTNVLTFSVDDLPTGIYFVRAVSAGIEMTGKFVISQ